MHQFFEGRFKGELQDSSPSFDRFCRVLEAEFEIITPTGPRVGRESLLRGLRLEHGTDPRSKIWIENFQARRVSEELCLVTYEEWFSCTFSG